LLYGLSDTFFEDYGLESVKHWNDFYDLVTLSSRFFEELAKIVIV